ncbi:MAG: S24 family peptidase, partial [Deltaproteobacteria bacterium]|nr:S24 family peptidase [Deltaproteobacteria bacterium]
QAELLGEEWNEGSQDDVLPFRRVAPRDDQKYNTCVPLISLKAAAGSFGESQEVVPEAWVEIPGARRLGPGMFVAQVVGKSMQPTIPDGSWCLFKAPVEGSRSGRVVLVQHRQIHDPDAGGSFTVKRYQSEKAEKREGRWSHEVIRLLPDNPDYPEIKLDPEVEGSVAVVAEFIQVLN